MIDPFADSGATAAIRAAMGGSAPTWEQQRAITHPAEPLAIIAGAGSGKTAIMAARMVWMVQEGLLKPSQILGLTFTNKAAMELEERIVAAFDRLDPHPGEVPTVSTYNSFADGIVRQHGVRVGVDPESSLLSQAQAWQLVAEALNEIEPFEAIDSRSIASITRAALGLADQCANNFVTPEEVEAEDALIIEREAAYEPEVLLNSRRRIELARLVRAYQNLKRRRRCMDFGDQVTKAVEILETWPSVAAELRTRFPAILLDEYQDTNVAQRRMMQALAPTGSNVTAVGDARQNIFQWRGSTIFNLIDFPLKHFLRAGERVHDYLSLSDNFRSGSRMVEVANSIIEAVPERRRPGKPLAATPANLKGFVGTGLFPDQREEAVFIAEEILRLHGRSAAPGRPPAAWRDFAILVRRKAHMGVLYSVLREREVPVEVAGLGGLLQVPEVMDTVAWLRLVADPGPASNRWMARIAMGPRYRIHYRDLAVLARWAAHQTTELRKAKEAESSAPADARAVPDESALEPDEVAFSLVEALDQVQEIEGLDASAQYRLLRLRSELLELRSMAGFLLLDLVQAIVSRTGIAEALQSSARKDAAAALGNVRQFMSVVANFSPVSGEPSLSEFLEYLDAAEDAEDTMELEVTPEEDSVKLTTVHGAKGLEFEVVFVPGVAAHENRKGEKVNSIFPDERASNPMISYAQLPYGVREDREHLPNPFRVDDQGQRRLKKKADFARELRERAVEDERRLFYVALTRAKQRLYVTAAWWYERQRKHHGSSIFFDEVAAHAAAEDLGRAERPLESPLMAELQARAVWPPRIEPIDAPSAEFPEGPVTVLEMLLTGELTAQELLDRLTPGDREVAERLAADHRALIRSFSSEALARPGAAQNQMPSLTASQAVDLAAGRVSAAQVARPLPQRPSPHARIGTEIHRWIESVARGLPGLVDEESLDAPGSHVERATLQQLKASFVSMGFAERKLGTLADGEPMVELKFVLKLGERLIRGRMDAVYETEEGGYEIVDFKSGQQTDLPEIDQLTIYAAALSKMGVVPNAELKLTYAYLTSETVLSRSISPVEAASALERLQEKLVAGVGS
jgi:DNA helicase-2/ATP-dependent DNA helicase PcrA